MNAIMLVPVVTDFASRVECQSLLQALIHYAADNLLVRTFGGLGLYNYRVAELFASDKFITNL